MNTSERKERRYADLDVGSWQEHDLKDVAGAFLLQVHEVRTDSNPVFFEFLVRIVDENFDHHSDEDWNEKDRRKTN